jgi:hypothetical protein
VEVLLTLHLDQKVDLQLLVKGHLQRFNVLHQLVVVVVEINLQEHLITLVEMVVLVVED